MEVAGKAPVTFEVRETHHGPLLEEEVAMWWAVQSVLPRTKISPSVFAYGLLA